MHYRRIPARHVPHPIRLRPRAEDTRAPQRHNVVVPAVPAAGVPFPAQAPPPSRAAPLRAAAAPPDPLNAPKRAAGRAAFPPSVKPLLHMSSFFSSFAFPSATVVPLVFLYCSARSPQKSEKQRAGKTAVYGETGRRVLYSLSLSRLSVLSERKRSAVIWVQKSAAKSKSHSQRRGTKLSLPQNFYLKSGPYWRQAA